MGEHMFGSGSGELTNEAFYVIDEIAERHDYSIVNINDPGQGDIYWFAGPSLGNPFDQQAEAAIWKELEEAGYADSNRKLLAKCFENQPDSSKD